MNAVTLVVLGSQISDEYNNIGCIKAPDSDEYSNIGCARSPGVT